jgi:hypothetical protein
MKPYYIVSATMDTFYYKYATKKEAIASRHTLQQDGASKVYIKKKYGESAISDFRY